MLTHAARAAAKQLPLVAARGAREGLWLDQQKRERTCLMAGVCTSWFRGGIMLPQAHKVPLPPLAELAGAVVTPLILSHGSMMPWGCQASKTAFRSRCARPGGTLHSEAFCPNIQPRAHARLTGLTSPGAEVVISISGGLAVCVPRFIGMTRHFFSVYVLTA